MALRTVFLAAVLFCGVIANDEIKQMGKVLHDSCVEEIGTPESLITEANKGNFINDDKLKCYMKCLFTSTSIMDEDGAIDIDIMKAMIPPSHMEAGLKVMNACKDVTGANACEKSFNIHLCIHKFSPDDYFIV